MKKSILKDKSKAFALRVIRLYKYLCEERKEYIYLSSCCVVVQVSEI